MVLTLIQEKQHQLGTTSTFHHLMKTYPFIFPFFTKWRRYPPSPRPAPASTCALDPTELCLHTKLYFRIPSLMSSNKELLPLYWCLNQHFTSSCHPQSKQEKLVLLWQLLPSSLTQIQTCFQSPVLQTSSTWIPFLPFHQNCLSWS